MGGELKDFLNGGKDFDWVSYPKPSASMGDLVVDYFTKDDGLGIEKRVTSNSFDRSGNTVPADLAIDLAEAVENKRVKRGDRLFLFTFGAGISAGALKMTY